MPCDRAHRYFRCFGRTKVEPAIPTTKSRGLELDKALLGCRIIVSTPWPMSVLPRNRVLQEAPEQLHPAAPRIPSQRSSLPFDEESVAAFIASHVLPRLAQIGQ